MNVVEYLLIGLPGQQPGGLILTVLYFAAAALAGLMGGFSYAAIAVLVPATALPLQVLTALLRGIPLLLLAFFFANLPNLSASSAGFIALSLYSFCHVGEILRGFLNTYPAALQEQTLSMGIGTRRDWLELRFRWTCSRALPSLLTHWVSLLKDTGALVVLGIGEMTTVAKLLSESSFEFGHWVMVMGMAAALYLCTTLILISVIERLGKNLDNWKSDSRFSLSQ